MNLLRVALGLGTGRQARASHAQIDQRHHVLEHDVLHPDLLDLLLVGGAELLLSRLPATLAAGLRTILWALLTGTHSYPRCACRAGAYVSRVSATVAAYVSASE